MTAELFQTITQAKLTHVPYEGTAPAINDLLAGNVDLMFNELATSIELHKSGRVRILAVTVKDRVPSLPDIPTLDEAGVHGCISDTWPALTAPPKTPPEIVAKLNAAANAALTVPALLERFKELSISPGGGTPMEIGAFIKEETRRWGEVVREAGVERNKPLLPGGRRQPRFSVSAHESPDRRGGIGGLTSAQCCMRAASIAKSSNSPTGSMNWASASTRCRRSTAALVVRPRHSARRRRASDVPGRLKRRLAGDPPRPSCVAMPRPPASPGNR
jgi:hypothetical protein